MIRTIVFNGPPNSGKDVLGLKVARAFGFNIASFKDSLYDIIADYFQIEKDTILSLCNDRETKEKPSGLLNGLSPRGALIYVSEELIKPTKGEQYFGAKVAERLSGTTVLTDGGFDSELAPIVEASDYTLIVRLHREGCSFEGDSRSYISDEIVSVPGYNVDIIDFNNSGNLKESYNKIINVVSMKLLQETLR